MTDISETGNPVAEAEEIITRTQHQVDYFGVDTKFQFMLPDGVSWIEHKLMSEGDRRKFLNKTNKDVRVAKGTGDAIIKMNPGDERAELLKVAICGWNLQRNGKPLPFTPSNLEQFLLMADPSIIDQIEDHIRKHNPWLRGNTTVADVDREIAELQELRAELLDAEVGKESS